MMMDSFEGFGFMFTLIPFIGIAFFIFVFGVIIVKAIKGLGQWNKNNNSPVLTVSAKIVAKRMNIETYHHTDNMNASHTSSSTTYYSTFEVESGDRMELVIPDAEYGMLVEGDVGKVTFQGTRYKGFERAI